MLQRIQTIYFILAMGCVLAMYATNINTYQGSAKAEYSLNMYEWSTLPEGASEQFTEHWYLLGVSGLLVVLLTVVILQFKNRLLQLRLARLAMLLCAGLVVANVIAGAKADEMVLEGLQKTYSVAFYLPIAALCFVFLGWLRVRADEKLIRSVDRLR